MTKVLYLWAGEHKSGTKAWKDDGAEIISVGIESFPDTTIVRDIIDVTVEELSSMGPFDFIWASPDCKVWSLANLHSGHWEKRGSYFIPATPKAIEMVQRVKWTLHLIESLNPTYWVLENPWGILRKMTWMQPYQYQEVTYCQYGDDRMKRTCLWGRFPRSFEGRSCNYNDSCHVSAKRGENSGTQALEWEDRIIVPWGLSYEIWQACKRDRGKSWVTLGDF